MEGLPTAGTKSSIFLLLFQASVVSAGDGVCVIFSEYFVAQKRENMDIFLPLSASCASSAASVPILGRRATRRSSPRPPPPPSGATPAWQRPQRWEGHSKTLTGKRNIYQREELFLLFPETFCIASSNPTQPYQTDTKNASQLYVQNIFISINWTIETWTKINYENFLPGFARSAASAC